MKRSFVNRLSAIIIMLGIVIILGATGSCENFRIGIGSYILMLLSGASMIAAGGLLLSGNGGGRNE